MGIAKTETQKQVEAFEASARAGMVNGLRQSGRIADDRPAPSAPVAPELTDDDLEATAARLRAQLAQPSPQEQLAAIEQILATRRALKALGEEARAR